ncbi:hypothetical protein VNO80_06797 [Phaseolus coccineus]|uniref:Uncharacterized protein n=1 Tax=Phaseolus coccineus TaxID=3886 RepID=A0AAN9NIM3_PHACN
MSFRSAPSRDWGASVLTSPRTPRTASKDEPRQLGLIAWARAMWAGSRRTKASDVGPKRRPVISKMPRSRERPKSQSVYACGRESIIRCRVLRGRVLIRTRVSQ